MNFTDRIASYFESMTPKRLLTLSLLAGFMAFFLVFMALSGKSDQKAKDEINMTMVKVVTAKADIAPRDEIREETVRIMEVPQSAVPEDAVKEISSIVGKPAKVAIMSGDIITGRKLFPDKKAAGFPGMVPEDCRAISLAIDDVTGVAGFALPGDYVDVMLVSDKLHDGAVTGELVMQNVLLLAINKTADATRPVAPGKDKDKGDSAHLKAMDNLATATLAVRPEEAVRLSVASKVGSLYLALRPFRPTNRYVMDTNYSINMDKATPQTATPPPSVTAPAAASVSAPSSGGQTKAAPARKADRGSVSAVEVIRGVQSTKE